MQLGFSNRAGLEKYESSRSEAMCLVKLQRNFQLNDCECSTLRAFFLYKILRMRISEIEAILPFLASRDNNNRVQAFVLGVEGKDGGKRGNHTRERISGGGGGSRSIIAIRIKKRLNNNERGVMKVQNESEIIY